MEHRSGRPVLQPPAESLHWYAAYTRSHHEKCVAKYLLHKGIECFVPLYKTKHAWSHHRTAELQLPLFPNYVFVRIDHRLLRPTLEVPGIYSIVSRGRDPEPLADEMVDQLRSGSESNSLLPCSYTPIGAPVRITAGPLAGVAGILVRKKNGLRVVLSVDLILKSVAIEVNGSEIVPL